MRRGIFVALLGVLAWLLAARAGLPSRAAVPASVADMTWDGQFYNVLDMDRTGPSGTAGSALLAETDGYFLSRMPTARHALTGALAGKNLVLLLAENWKIDALDAARTPVLYRLWSDGVHFSEVYAPDWYQGLDGRQFALLSGLVPTTVRSSTSMAWIGQQNTSLPFSLAACLSTAGYTCRAYPDQPGQEAAYTALGFEAAETVGDENVGAALPALSEGGPFFAYYVIAGTDGEPVLSRLWQIMEEAGLADDTAVCLVAGHQDALRGHLFLWGPGLAGTDVTLPCSELDVTPTLLDLFGAAYDARFLSGRDMFAPETSGPAALVSLYGSAYSDWVTGAGSYLAEQAAFFPTDDRFTGQQKLDYVRQTCQAVYDRYAYARQILESNYFRAAEPR